MEPIKKRLDLIPPSPQPFVKPATGKGFSFTEYENTISVPRPFITFRPPRIVKTKSRWYVEYWYRIPVELRGKYKNKVWERFRVFEDINRHKSDEYAEILLNSVTVALKNGYNPFGEEKQAECTPPVDVMSLNAGLDKFLEYHKHKGSRKKTLQAYTLVVDMLKEYFLRDNKIYESIGLFTKREISDFLTAMKKKNGFNNTTFNNYLRNTRVIFNWFVKEDYLTKSPVSNIEYLAAKVTKHKYFDDKTAALLKATMLKERPTLYRFCELCFYSGLRPLSEARLLQVKHILMDRKLIFIPAEISKNKKDDYIPMADGLIALLNDMKVEDYPADYYIFGIYGIPSERPASPNFFAKPFTKIRDSLGIDKNCSLYSWKHTMAISLANAGASPYDIMRLFRHSDLAVTSRYLRDLGCDISDEVNKRTKKF